jgi:membrane-associated protease RseP (regulator of RpoE activity)
MNLWRKSIPERAVAEPSYPYRDPHLVPPLPRRAASIAHRPWLHALLFFLTLVSMAAAGAMQQGVNPLAGPEALVHLVEGIPFAVALLCILTVHEFGHYFAARRWQVRASLPYFLPLPYISFLGTLGAVIKIRSAIPNKRALLDIGAAGPLAGFVVAIVACVIGLFQSAAVPIGHFYEPPIRLGAPLLFSGLAWLILPAASPGQMILLSPVAFAGWVGLFITAFNLFPVGQLDGGHIIFALFGSWHRRIARLFFAILLGMGLYGILSLIWEWPQGWPGWLALAFFLTLFGKDHPAPYDAYMPLDRTRRRVGYLCLFVFVLCFSPVPFST